MQLGNHCGQLISHCKANASFEPGAFFSKRRSKAAQAIPSQNSLWLRIHLSRLLQSTRGKDVPFDIIRCTRRRFASRDPLRCYLGILSDAISQTESIAKRKDGECSRISGFLALNFRYFMEIQENPFSHLHGQRGRSQTSGDCDGARHICLRHDLPFSDDEIWRLETGCYIQGAFWQYMVVICLIFLSAFITPNFVHGILCRQGCYLPFRYLKIASSLATMLVRCDSVGGMVRHEAEEVGEPDDEKKRPLLMYLNGSLVLPPERDLFNVKGLLKESDLPLPAPVILSAAPPGESGSVELSRKPDAERKDSFRELDSGSSISPVVDDVNT